MNRKQTKKVRQRLSLEYEKLIKSINRNRVAAEEITIENTEDESDLATISHDRALLYNLHESDFARLRFIQEAIKAIDYGHYGECIRCEDDIDEKRLKAVPWARLCIKCQEQAEIERASSNMVLAGSEDQTDF